MSLSEQELVDFVNTTGSQGGFKEDGFQSIMDNCWLSSVAEYPFRGVNRTCNTEKSTWDALLKAVGNHPVALSINAESKAFGFYSEGVFTGECGTNLNHEVFDPLEHRMGERGYIRMQRDVAAPEGICGIAMAASYRIA
ncbi:hypothetical protein AMTRI_Chr10g229220 [Amborella trichopoda]